MAKLTPLALILVLAACSNGGGKAAPSLQDLDLDNQIGRAVGDPSTCVILADRKTGKTLYTYGVAANCAVALPACDRPGTLTAKQAVPLADSLEGRHAGCDTRPDGSRSVGWAQGRVTSTAGRDLTYTAVMEGERALPGLEMSDRLVQAFKNAGL